MTDTKTALERAEKAHADELWRQRFEIERIILRKLKAYELMVCKKHGLAHHFFAAHPGGELHSYVRACILCGKQQRIKKQDIRALLPKKLKGAI